MDKNGIKMKTGDIVKIEGGFFKADNGTFLVKHSPGDPSWSGSDYSLHKCSKKGVESESKHSTAFWPLMVTVSSRDKRIEAKRHNAEHATIEIIGSVKVYSLSVKESRGWNDYETKEIATKKRYQELLACKYTEVEVISESINERKSELPVHVLAEEVAPVEVVKITAEEPKPSIAAIEAIAPTTTMQSSSLINESLAKRSKENMSFSDYKPGSATREFNQEIAEVTVAIEIAKAKVSPEAQAKLDRLLSSHTARYAAWTNKRNANGAGHVSVMIAGPSNYNMRKHEKYMSREGKLWAEYDEFKDIYNRIDSIVAGDRIIKSDDANAIDKLKEKLAKLEEMQELMKSSNKVIKNKKWTDDVKIELLTERGIGEERATELLKPSHCCSCGFASYELTNNNATIRNVKQRIAHLERLAAQETREIIVETESEETGGIRIVDNVEAHRLQIFFNGKPPAEVRARLGKSGFRWTPSIGAWQSYRSERANRAAREIVSAM